MKIIVQTPENIAWYKFPDGIVVDLQSDRVIVGSPKVMEIAWLNELTCTAYDGITVPEDFVESKYLFDGTNWSLNPNFSG